MCQWFSWQAKECTSIFGKALGTNFARNKTSWPNSYQLIWHLIQTKIQIIACHVWLLIFPFDVTVLVQACCRIFSTDSSRIDSWQQIWLHGVIRFGVFWGTPPKSGMLFPAKGNPFVSLRVAILCFVAMYVMVVIYITYPCLHSCCRFKSNITAVR